METFVLVLLYNIGGDLSKKNKKANCLKSNRLFLRTLTLLMRPYPVSLLSRSKLAVIERGIMAAAGKQPLMGTTFDDIAVFHV